jgi:asparagine synthase (glutamine-hydrolysing)
MCGIAGILSLNTSLVNKNSLKRMADSLTHRGPDGEGFFINNAGTVGLTHRRLAIIDLSAAASQPMHYLERYSIVYNGEIYNYKQLKTFLQSKNYIFYSESDTEVILAAYDFYRADCVKYFDGMFAFAIWDEVTQTLFCARDIFGEKPFYYFIQNDAIAFASEMKALWAVGIDKKYDEDMLVNYVALGEVSNPLDNTQTFFKNIYSFPAAHSATYFLQTNQLEFKRYANIDTETVSNLTENEAVEKLENLLQASVESRLQSDVEVGTSLSGGIDSSTIAYFTHAKKNNAYKIFSAIFPGFENDESQQIKNICDSLNLSANFVTPTAEDLVSSFEKIAYHQEEPFVSASVFAQYKVYELAAQHNVKVILDGQGSDEIFAGYSKYVHWYLQELIGKNKFAKVWKVKKDLQKNNIPFNFGLANIAATHLPQHAAMALENKQHKKLFANNVLNKDLVEHAIANENTFLHKPVITQLNDILKYNLMQHGLGELLRYADRNSMVHGVEVRLPFLNKALIDLVFALPSSFKINNGFTKFILRQTMQNKIPDTILWNPKKIGFEPPQKLWMQNKAVQEMIHAAKEKLVQQNIIQHKVLDEKVNLLHAHEADNTDWRMLSLAQVL